MAALVYVGLLMPICVWIVWRRFNPSTVYLLLALSLAVGLIPFHYLLNAHYEAASRANQIQRATDQRVHEFAGFFEVIAELHVPQDCDLCDRDLPTWQLRNPEDGGLLLDVAGTRSYDTLTLFKSTRGRQVTGPLSWRFFCWGIIKGDRWCGEGPVATWLPSKCDLNSRHARWVDVENPTPALLVLAFLILAGISSLAGKLRRRAGASASSAPTRDSV